MLRRGTAKRGLPAFRLGNWGGGGWERRGTEGKLVSFFPGCGTEGAVVNRTDSAPTGFGVLRDRLRGVDVSQPSPRLP